MLIRRANGVNCCERKLTSKLHMDESVKARLDQEERRIVKTGKGIRQGCCLPPILFNSCNEYLASGVPAGFGDFKIERK